MSENLWQALDYLEQGGWIMVPLGLASLAMWTLILERFNTFRQLSRKDIRLDHALKALQGTSLEKVRRDGLRARVLRGFLAERCGDMEIDLRVLQRVRMREAARLTCYLSVIAVLAAMAPLLGLLGTVLGMIETFNVISLFGTGNTKAMAGGISIALVTTQTGLLIAIPGLFLSGVLQRRARHLMTRLDEISTVLSRFIRQNKDEAHMAKAV